MAERGRAGLPAQPGRGGAAPGFSLNTAELLHHRRGNRLQEKRFFEDDNGAHYVIDTSRNGAGPAEGRRWTGATRVVNLGVAPTTATAGEHADAYLWVKRRASRRLVQPR